VTVCLCDGLAHVAPSSLYFNNSSATAEIARVVLVTHHFVTKKNKRNWRLSNYRRRRQFKTDPPDISPPLPFPFLPFLFPFSFPFVPYSFPPFRLLSLLPLNPELGGLGERCKVIRRVRPEPGRQTVFGAFYGQI